MSTETINDAHSPCRSISGSIEASQRRQLPSDTKQGVFNCLPNRKGPEELVFSDDTPFPNVNEFLRNDYLRRSRQTTTTIRLKTSLSRSPNLFTAIWRIATGVRCFTTLILETGAIDSRALNFVIALLPRLRSLDVPVLGFQGSCTDTDIQNFANALTAAPRLQRIACGDLRRYDENGKWYAVADAVADAIERLHRLECLALHPSGTVGAETWAHRRPAASNVTLCFDRPVPTEHLNWPWFLSVEAPIRCLTIRGGHIVPKSFPRPLSSEDTVLDRKICMHPSNISDPVSFGFLMMMFRDTAQCFRNVRVVLDTHFGSTERVSETLTCVDKCFLYLDTVPNIRLSVEWKISDLRSCVPVPSTAFRVYLGLLKTARDSICDTSKTSRFVISAKPTVVESIVKAFEEDVGDLLSNYTWLDLIVHDRLHIKEKKEEDREEYCVY